MALVASTRCGRDLADRGLVNDRHLLHRRRGGGVLPLPQFEAIPSETRRCIEKLDVRAGAYALKTLRTCPVSMGDAWNCQNWVRECVGQLYESGDILEESYNAFCAWSDRILAGYEGMTKPGQVYIYPILVVAKC